MISLLQFSDTDNNGVVFYIDYGKLLGLSFATERVCIVIDSSILHNCSLIRACFDLRYFWGSCLMGSDIWKLMLVLFDHLRLKSGI